MAELITIKGTAQAEGKQIKGYLFPDKIEDFPVPSTVYFAPNYGAILYDKVSGQNTGKSYPSINVIDKGNEKLLADNGLYLKWMPSGIAWGKTQMLVSVPPSQGVTTTNTNTQLVSVPPSQGVTTTNTNTQLPPSQGVTTTNTNTQQTKTATMGRYKILKDYDNPVTKIKFYVGEVVEGTPSTTTNGMFIDVLRNGKSSLLADKFEIQKVSDDTPLSSASTQQVTATAKKEMGLSIAGFIGSAAGFGFAYYKKMGILGYIGMAVVGGIVGSLAYHTIAPKKAV